MTPKNPDGKGNMKRSVIMASAVMIVFAVFLLMIGLVKKSDNEILEKTNKALQESLEEAEKIAESLEERKSRDLTDEEKIKIARERFGLVFPNEVIFIPEEE